MWCKKLTGPWSWKTQTEANQRASKRDVWKLLINWKSLKIARTKATLLREEQQQKRQQAAQKLRKPENSWTACLTNRENKFHVKFCIKYRSILFKMNKRKRIVSAEEKVKEFIASRPVLQEIIKEVLGVGENDISWKIGQRDIKYIRIKLTRWGETVWRKPLN